MADAGFLNFGFVCYRSLIFARSDVSVGLRAGTVILLLDTYYFHDVEVS